MEMKPEHITAAAALAAATLAHRAASVDISDKEVVASAFEAAYDALMVGISRVEKRKSAYHLGNVT